MTHYPETLHWKIQLDTDSIKGLRPLERQAMRLLLCNTHRSKVPLTGFQHYLLKKSPQTLLTPDAHPMFQGSFISRQGPELGWTNLSSLGI